MQQFVEECPLAGSPQLFIIEESAGSGKTEAALMLAHRLMAAGLGEGIFIGLPTMATADAMYRRIRKAYRRMYTGDREPSIVLAHSRSHLLDDFGRTVAVPAGPAGEPRQYGSDEETATASCAAWLADNRKKALLAQVGIGTVDQALMAVLLFKHQSLRLLGLARNVLIVDEVHAYDPYMQTVLGRLLCFHAALGGSAILLSATLPRSARSSLISQFRAGLGLRQHQAEATAYPLVTHCRGAEIDEHPVASPSGRERTVTFEPTSSMDEVIAELQTEVTEGRCACCIRNTVDDAVEAFLQVRREIPEADLLLFHARFALGDRLVIEREVLDTFGKGIPDSARAGKILIATQVVEQSLDIDFDFMVTDLAPIDLVIQRAGRLQRHDRGDRGARRLMVLMPPMDAEPDRDWFRWQFPRAARVYPNHGQLYMTADLISRTGFLSEPGQASEAGGVRWYIEEVFSPERQARIPAALVESAAQADGEDHAAISIATMRSLGLAEGYWYRGDQWQEDTRVFTRLSEPSNRLLLTRWTGSGLLPWHQTLGTAWDYSEVTVAAWRVARIVEGTGPLAAAVEQLRERLPDRGQWRSIVPLVIQDGRWVARGFDDRGQPVLIEYDPEFGLRTNK